MRTGWVTALLCTLLGCASAQEKCAEAKQKAVDSWTKYSDELDADLKAAEAKDVQYEKTMREKVTPRMHELAEQEADRRHNRSTPEWLRAFEAHAKAVCTTDDECKQLKMDQRENTTRIEELKALQTLANNAASAVTNKLEAAPASAKAVEDFERPSVKVARADTDAAFEACAELP